MTATSTRESTAPDAIAAPALELTDLVQHFGPVRAVDGVSLTVGRGRVVALVGESGSGKSTVGRCVVRLTRPTAGQVRVCGVDVTNLRGRALRRERGKAAIVFQDPASSLDPRMAVGDVIAEPLRLLGLAARPERGRRVAELLGQVGLRAEVAGRHPHELSGGMRQRVSIARALVGRPQLLVADEPTSALDVSVQASVLNLVADLQRDLGFACLFITHDLSVVDHLADDVAVLYLGRLVETGTRDQVLSHPRHPYTQALLSAAPVPDPVLQRTRRRVLLTGDVPSPLDVPPGCRFATRCPAAVGRCHVEEPQLRPVGPRPPVGPSGSVRSPDPVGSVDGRDGRARVACHLVADDGTGPDVRDTRDLDTHDRDTHEPDQQAGRSAS